MSAEKDLLKKLVEDDVKFIDFRFSDFLGKFHHITYRTINLTEFELQHGIRFDGSSIIGWKEVHQSDMLLKPDLSTVFFDPFFSELTAVIICDVYDPTENARYVLDPRSVAVKAEEYLKKSGIAELAYFGPELEFFVFDNVRFENSAMSSFFYLDSEESHHNSGKQYENGNLGHRSGHKNGYMPVPPMDSLHDLRSDMLLEGEKIGLKMLLHHHEVAQAQCEIGFEYDTLTKAADNIQKFKYVVQNVAASYNKTATFMPKPIYGDNGSCMHTHQSLWSKGKPLFYQKSGYAELSELCLYYIGGIIKHAKVLNAFTNPSTNSYKRLVPGYEAPVLMTYSEHNRSAAIRIPYTHSPNGKRIEARFPDPMANPYLAFSAMIMAGLDGIKNKIHPGAPHDYNLYSLGEKETKKIPHVSHSLREALLCLDKDRGFLKEGGVFDDDLIDSYIKLKMREVKQFEMAPHPIEFVMYYSL